MYPLLGVVYVLLFLEPIFGYSIRNVEGEIVTLACLKAAALFVHVFFCGLVRSEIGFKGKNEEALSPSANCYVNFVQIVLNCNRSILNFSKL